jgi:hypothetical protein
MRHVESDKKIGLAIDGRFQNHLVSRIREFGSPREAGYDQHADCSERVNDHIDVVARGTCGGQMLPSLEHGLVFEQERHREQEFEALT